MPEWFEEWFGEEYLELYPHRDEAEADRAVALVARSTGLRAGWRVLDVGCGAGRHARAFRAAGARCVGVDLSQTLLRIARRMTDAPLVRADMRLLPIRPGSMDLTVSLFTSFGYFDDDEEHTRALREMAGTLRPGVVTGKNFGCGSSRQQAVDCFISLGIQAIIAESFGAIYERNAINAAFPIISQRDLSRTDLQDGDMVTIDLKTGEIKNQRTDRLLMAEPFSDVQMELYQKGGLLGT
jgi:3-isopropylmalate dehydratase small subunit